MDGGWLNTCTLMPFNKYSPLRVEEQAEKMKNKPTITTQKSIEFLEKYLNNASPTCFYL